jgi:hypothetical protein
LCFVRARFKCLLKKRPAHTNTRAVYNWWFALCEYTFTLQIVLTILLATFYLHCLERIVSVLCAYKERVLCARTKRAYCVRVLWEVLWARSKRTYCVRELSVRIVCAYCVCVLLERVVRAYWENVLCERTKRGYFAWVLRERIVRAYYKRDYFEWVSILSTCSIRPKLLANEASKNLLQPVVQSY